MEEIGSEGRWNAMKLIRDLSMVKANLVRMAKMDDLIKVRQR